MKQAGGTIALIAGILALFAPFLEGILALFGSSTAIETSAANGFPLALVCLAP